MSDAFIRVDPNAPDEASLKTKILQQIGVLGPDGKLAPAYADDGDDSTAEADSTR